MMLTVSQDVNGTYITREPGPINTPEDVSTYCGRVYAILIVDPDNAFDEFYEFNNYASQMVLLRCASNGKGPSNKVKNT